jgi:hypothetical protein
MADLDDELSVADPVADKEGEQEPIARSLDPDSILDALVPASIDWRGTVRRHPVVSVTTLGLVGYLVGRTKGAAIMAGVTAGLSGALMRQLGDVFEGDFFDFD